MKGEKGNLDRMKTGMQILGMDFHWSNSWEIADKRVIAITFKKWLYYIVILLGNSNVI